MSGPRPTPRDAPVASLDTGALLGALVVDVRELVGAHADGLREALAGDVRNLRDTLVAYVVAAAVVIVAAIALASAAAGSLIGLGVPWLAALWAVASVPIVLALVLAGRARARTVGERTTHALVAADAAPDPGPASPRSPP